MQGMNIISVSYLVFQSRILENVLDADLLSPVLGSSKFGMGTASIDSAWKEEVCGTAELHKFLFKPIL